MKKKRIQILPPKKKEEPKQHAISEQFVEKQIPALTKEELDKLLSGNAQKFLEQNRQKDGE